MALNRIERRRRIHYRIRKHVNGTAERPRMVVFRSNKQIYVQVINDLEGKTLVAAASNDKALAAERDQGQEWHRRRRHRRQGDRRARPRRGYHQGRFRPRRLSLPWQS